jgi:site-specific DNA-methyltransferase (adenine-specific)
LLELNTLYNMDCMEGMKQFPDKYFELAVVDPPYGGNDAIDVKDCQQKNKQATARTNYKQFENIAPSQQYFDELKRVSKKQIIWGVNFYTVSGLNGGRIVWDKKGTAFGRAEMAYYSHSASVEVFEYAWNGMLQGDMKNKEIRIHPTQKPVALYRWLLQNYAKQGDKILDTHVGSASSLIACYDAGHDYIGFELDPDYHKAACDRIARHKQQIRLDVVEPNIEQMGLEV